MWTDSALIERIAQWTLANMVNRVDVWGIYELFKDAYGVEHNQYTAPAKKHRGKMQLDLAIIRRHWMGKTSMGLHSTSADDTCRWLAFDIDAHDETQDVATLNFNNALAIASVLANNGMECIVEDSNGRGGIHVWAVFSAPVPSPYLYRFGRKVLADTGIACEVFPKQERASQTANGFGNYIRLPGKHYKRDHWSRIWTGEKWLAGDDALLAMLEAKLNDPQTLPLLEPEKPAEVRLASCDVHYAPNPDRDLQTCIDAIACIANDFSYDDWIRMGYILKSAGGEAMFTVFDQWSATSPKYDARLTRMKWDSLKDSGQNKAGIGTLVHWAKQRGYSPKKGDSLPDQWHFDAVNGLQVGVGPLGSPITPASPAFEIEPPEAAAPSVTVAAEDGEIKTTARPQKRYPTKEEIDRDFAERSKPIVPDPLPIIKGPPIYRPFPLELFPQSVADFIRCTAEAKSVPIEFIALPLLSAIGAAIGLSRRIEIKGGWREYPTIWTCILGRTGTTKTPAINSATFANAEQQRRAHHIWQQKMDTYKEQLNEYEQAKKSKLSTMEKPEEPKEEQCVCKDITIEALAIVLRNNPRGVLLMSDELSGWFRSFGAYKGGRGSDKEHWLSIFSSQEININRKVGDEKHIYVPASVVCIAGATQPETIKEIMSDDMHEAGMASRMLMAYPPEMVNECNFNDVPEGLKLEMERYINFCFSLKVERDIYDNPTAKTIPIDDDARSIWKRWHDANGEEMLFLDNKCRAVWGKALSHAARFALLLHLLDQADGLEHAMGNSVAAPVVQRAIQLAEWFKVEQQRIYMTMGHSQEQRDAYAVIEYLEEHGGAASSRDIYRAVRRLRRDEIRKRTIDTLIQSKIIKIEHGAPDDDGGRPSQRIVLIAKPQNTRQNTYENF